MGQIHGSVLTAAGSHCGTDTWVSTDSDRVALWDRYMGQY